MSKQGKAVVCVALMAGTITIACSSGPRNFSKQGAAGSGPLAGSGPTAGGNPGGTADAGSGAADGGAAGNAPDSAGAGGNPEMNAGSGGKGDSGGASGATGGGGAGTSGGASGSSGASGSGGAGGSAGRPFVGGPCATAIDQSTIEIFAHGSDHNIYRRPFSSGVFGPWQALIGLDGSQIDARSDLDCAGQPTATRVAGTGMNGEFLEAIGLGTSFNPLTRQFPSTSFDPSCSVATIPYTSYAWLAGIGASGIRLNELNGSTATDLPRPQSDQASAPDLAALALVGQYSVYVAAFNTAKQLAVDEYLASSSSTSWQPPVVLAPPMAKAFEFSPTICADSGEGGGNGAHKKHLAAVAGSTLWYAEGDGRPLTFSAWEQIDTGVTSAPDCTVLNDSTVHVVSLRSGGNVVDVFGSAGSWQKQDLGTL